MTRKLVNMLAESAAREERLRAEIKAALAEATNDWLATLDNQGRTTFFAAIEAAASLTVAHKLAKHPERIMSTRPGASVNLPSDQSFKQKTQAVACVSMWCNRVLVNGSTTDFELCNYCKKHREVKSQLTQLLQAG